jgi:hypothetical protein
MKLLIFIITYKASFRINKIMNEMPYNFLKNHNFKILISDDHSDDDTQNFAIKIKKEYSNILLNFNKKNLGYGGNIKKCLNFAYKNKFDKAVMIHGDNQYSSKYLKDIINLSNKNTCSAVTGSRMKKKKSALKGGMPIYKFIGNVFLTKMFNLIYKTNFTDCHTGYWLYNLKKIKKNWIKNLSDNYLFDLDMRLKLINKKMIIKETAIKTRYGTERSLFHFNYAFIFVIKIFLNRIKIF